MLVLAHAEPSHAGAPLLLAALGAQFVADFIVSSVRFTILRGARLSSVLRSTWVYVIDAALSGIALVVALDVHDAPLAALSLVPLLGLLAVFAHERQQAAAEHARAIERVPRHRARARRRDRGRRRLHRRALQERRQPRARARRTARAQPRAPAQPRVRRAPARRRQDRDPQGDHQQARQARPPRVDDHQDPHPRGPEDARPRRRLHARGRHHRPLPPRALGRRRLPRRPRRRGRSRSRPGSSPAATPGTRCAPTAPTARPCPTT